MIAGSINRILLKASAAKEIEKLGTKHDRRRIVEKISGLADDPRLKGSEKLSGYDRYRVPRVITESFTQLTRMSWNLPYTRWGIVRMCIADSQKRRAERTRSSVAHRPQWRDRARECKPAPASRPVLAVIVAAVFTNEWALISIPVELF